VTLGALLSDEFRAPFRLRPGGCWAPARRGQKPLARRAERDNRRCELSSACPSRRRCRRCDRIVDFGRFGAANPNRNFNGQGVRWRQWKTPVRRGSRLTPSQHDQSVEREGRPGPWAVLQNGVDVDRFDDIRPIRREAAERNQRIDHGLGVGAPAAPAENPRSTARHAGRAKIRSRALLSRHRRHAEGHVLDEFQTTRRRCRPSPPAPFSGGRDAARSTSSSPPRHLLADQHSGERVPLECLRHCVHRRP